MPDRQSVMQSSLASLLERTVLIPTTTGIFQTVEIIAKDSS